MDRGYYAEHALGVGPPPVGERRAHDGARARVRVNASEDLRFGRGLSAEDEADLYEANLTGAIRLWLDVGLPTKNWCAAPLRGRKR